MVQSNHVLVAGNNNLTYSIVACLLNSGFPVNLFTRNMTEASLIIESHLSDIENENFRSAAACDTIAVSDDLSDFAASSMAIIITAEDVDAKIDMLKRIGRQQPAEVLIAINTESITLDQLQQEAIFPDRVVGLNWTEPAHTTRFMEIITNGKVRKGLTDKLQELAVSWNKDPYFVNNVGLRSKLLSSMIREAFYLVDNGYATVDDIDRACRNDAGYYLSFAGNCRYMDLMGTYAYGMVMKDLNPDLSKDRNVPAFFTDVLNDGGLGMQNGNGLYAYTSEERASWNKVFNEFSYQISRIINKYPFNYRQTK